MKVRLPIDILEEIKEEDSEFERVEEKSENIWEPEVHMFEESSENLWGSGVFAFEEGSENLWAPELQKDTLGSEVDWGSEFQKAESGIENIWDLEATDSKRDSEHPKTEDEEIDDRGIKLVTEEEKGEIQ